MPAPEEAAYNRGMGDRGTDGYGAEPKAGSGPGVLVLHPWWGLNADVRAFCDRLADAGFVVSAPDLFDGRIATTVAEAESLVGDYETRQAAIEARIGDAVKRLVERTGREGIAVVGFSFGAYYALELSNADPDPVRAVVVFYGTGPDDFTRSRAAYLGHFAGEDAYEPAESVAGLAKSLRDAGRPTTIHTYPGTGHWFFEPSVAQAYDEAAARLAEERTLDFLRDALA